MTLQVHKPKALKPLTVSVQKLVEMGASQHGSILRHLVCGDDKGILGGPKGLG